MDKTDADQNEDLGGLHAEVAAIGSRVSHLEEEMADLKTAHETREATDRLYSVKDLRKRWGVSERTVRNVIEKGYIEPTYIQSSLRFTWAAIEAYESGRAGRGKGKQIYRALRVRRFNPDTGRMEWARAPVSKRPPNTGGETAP